MPRRLMVIALLVADLIVPMMAAAQDATPPVATSSPGWTNWKGDSGRTGQTDAGPTGQPFQLWRAQAGGSCDFAPAVVAGIVYASCSDGVLYALDAATGVERWRFTGTALGDVTVESDLVYIGDADILHALNAATGAERWTAPVPGGTSAVVDHGLLVIGSSDGNLIGLDAASGSERWRYQISTGGSAHNPALADGIAYAGGDDSGLVAVDAVSGQLLWKGDTGTEQTGTAVVAEGLAYLGSGEGDQGHLYAFDATTGVLRWTRDDPLFSPTVLDGVGYSGGDLGNVVAFDTATGAERWRVHLGGAIHNVAIAGEMLYTVSDGNNVNYALDAATGTQLWSFPVDSGIDGGIAVAGGVVYETTTFGGIYAIGGTEQGATAAASPAVPSPTGAPGASPVATESPAASPVAVGPPEVVWTSTGPRDGLSFPAAMALDSQGHLWVADTGHDRFVIVDADGKVLETWGSPGTGDGQFELARSNGDGYGAVAFAPDGTFYVLDPGNHRVQKFAADRSFQLSWGTFGSEPGQFVNPISIAVDAGDTVYVLDDARDVVERYSAEGAVLGSFDAHPETNGGTNTANQLALDAEGNVYVSDITGLDTSPSPSFRVQKFDPAGNVIATFGAFGSGDGQFRGQPLGIAIDAAGNVFVGETPEGGRVQVFAADGTFITSWGGEGQLPWGPVLDGQGNAYVADYLANTVTKYRLPPELAAGGGTPRV